jgi:hypothetical protein
VHLQSGGVSALGSVRYDPARRRVVFAPTRGQMIPRVVYEFSVGTGLLAWDGAPLATRLLERFFVDESSDPPAAPPTRPALRADVMPVFVNHCAVAGCHAGANPRMGLDLSTAEAVQATAVGVLARETVSDPSASGPAYSDPRWGALDRVDPGIAVDNGEPAYSYLVYKILGDGPISGAQMPPPPDRAPLTRDEIILVSDWIARGAPND